MAVAPAEAGGALPELANVHWRRRADERSLRRAGRLWTVSTAAHTVPFVLAALVLGLADPILLPFALLCLVHAWAIPELYAARGARVTKRAGGDRDGSERVALGLLGDLVDHRARELHGRSGLMLERGRLGVWLVGEAGAMLVRPGGRRVASRGAHGPGGSDVWVCRGGSPGRSAGPRRAALWRLSLDGSWRE